MDEKGQQTGAATHRLNPVPGGTSKEGFDKGTL